MDVFFCHIWGIWVLLPLCPNSACFVFFLTKRVFFFSFFFFQALRIEVNCEMAQLEVENPINPFFPYVATPFLPYVKK